MLYQRAAAGGDPEMRLRLGLTLCRLGRHGEAAEHLRAAASRLDLPADRAAALLHLAGCRDRQGRRLEALAWYAEAYEACLRAGDRVGRAVAAAPAAHQARRPEAVNPWRPCGTLVCMGDLAARLRELDLSGIAVITGPGGVEFEECFGLADRAAGIPITPGDPVRAGLGDQDVHRGHGRPRSAWTSPRRSSRCCRRSGARRRCDPT